jgi:16S rRNA (guanine527-N7)-methyltransferase
MNPESVEILLKWNQKMNLAASTVVSKTLFFKHVDIVHGRAEELGRVEKFREKFDIATARAVAPLNILLEYAVPFVKVGGYFIAMKGRDIGEISQCKNALKELKCKVEDVIEAAILSTI